MQESVPGVHLKVHKTVVDGDHDTKANADDLHYDAKTCHHLQMWPLPQNATNLLAEKDVGGDLTSNLCNY